MLHREGVDDLRIVVAQERLHLWKPGLEVKEDRPTAHERLDVSLHVSGKKWVQLREKLAFAPGPFQEGLRFGDGVAR